MAEIVVFGAGPVADVVVAYLERFSDHRIVGFTVDPEFKRTSSFRGRPLVGWDELERHFSPDEVMLLGPVSYRRVNQFRRDRYLEGKARGYRFATFVHPNCDILTEEIGENCFILERNIIQPFARIGDNVVMWSGNHIGHHVTIADHCFITSQVGIAGATTIGECCFLGGKAGAIDNLSIGDHCFLGAGAVAIESLPPNSVLFAARPHLAPLTPSLLERLP